MATTQELSAEAINFVQSLLNSVPQYVLGVLPAIAILGASPKNGLMNKFMYLFCSLGAPFEGLFYYMNVKNDKLKMSSYWLEAENFVINGVNLAYKPFGCHAKRIMQGNLTPVQQKIIKKCEGCAAEASILDRFSSVVSIYYIIVGIVAGLSRVFGPCVREDWPYIPLALAWTLPAVFKRIWGGIMIVHDPKKRFPIDENNESNNRTIEVVNYQKAQRHHKYIRVILTAFFSIVTPWFSVILAYFTPRVGYFCRSRYLTVLCGIWTLNSILTLVFHIKGENNRSRLIVHIVTSISGVLVAILLILLVILSLWRPLWVKFGGDMCADDKSFPCIGN